MTGMFELDLTWCYTGPLSLLIWNTPTATYKICLLLDINSNAARAEAEFWMTIAINLKRRNLRFKLNIYIPETKDTKGLKAATGQPLSIRHTYAACAPTAVRSQADPLRKN
jgi:hypothetical protein